MEAAGARAQSGGVGDAGNAPHSPVKKPRGGVEYARGWR